MGRLMTADPPASAGAPPGWYSDPGRRYLYRWWEGSAWTDRAGGNGIEHVSPIMYMAAPPASGTSAGEGPLPPHTGTSGGERKVTLPLWAAIVVVVGAVAVGAGGGFTAGKAQSPESCIEAMDLASDAFGIIGSALASGNPTQIETAANILDSMEPRMRNAAQDCRSEA